MGAGPIVAGLGLVWMGRLDADVNYVTELLPAVLVFGARPVDDGRAAHQHGARRGAAAQRRRRQRRQQRRSRASRACWRSRRSARSWRRSSARRSTASWPGARSRRRRRPRCARSRTEHLGLLGDLPQVLIVKRDLPPDNFKAFVEYVRANEAKLNVGTAGPGSSAHMGAAMLNVRLGTKVNLVSYRGTGPAMNDLIAGQIDYMVEVSLTALAQIQAKTVRPLAVFRSARISTLPEVPSTNEFGVDGLDFPVWLGFLAPKGTPQPIVERLNASIRKATQDTTLRARLAPLGLEMPVDATNTPTGFRNYIQSEIDRWVPLIQKAGLTIE